uniref:Ig-like domain-containing protein n=1 Tax=Myotis lucifugus TaxID=59463 RepID=G1QF79_MYOLU
LCLYSSFLIMSVSISGSRSQAVVTQEPSESVVPGVTVTLTCSTNTGEVTSGHYPYWIQQKPGQVPRTLIYDTSNKLSWTPARFSGSIQGGKAALTLSGAQPEDEAEYYCALGYSGR